VENWKNITNSQNSVRKNKFGRTFSCSICHIKELHNGSIVLIVFGLKLDVTTVLRGYRVVQI
jgi:hypothetical protein